MYKRQASDRHELNMVFHFDHMHLDYDENGKYAKNRVKLTDLKEVMTKWQDNGNAGSSAALWRCECKTFHDAFQRAGYDLYLLHILS